ncbi:exonuclease SbcCD subunit D [Phycicoccus flavus]|uniref:exonuclease SbcCD subunit D n=1 Tax=Phycicoccus flavus TaxID=2502783 RepID=UPI000FEBC3D0|nr:exonuclease SbcCD subunit D [Phycicoccus flavus]NHA70006.1 exonuclease SbcCD subunit D [Phycicoccus flavus]
MRLLHTSDWHLGRSFHGVGLLGAQAAVLDHLVGVVRSEAVDAVLVSGDVYDRALPSPDTVALLSETLERLVDTGTAVVVSSGNHDSATRLGFASGLLERAGVHVRTAVHDVGRPVLLGDAAVYPLPYLEPALVADPLGATGRTHADVLRAAMDRVRADAAGRGVARTVVMAHAFVGGGFPSESERDIAVGGVALAPPEIFDGVDYAALGHLHGRQRVADRVRYSGSPVAMSFGEWQHRKGALVVDLAGAEPAVTEVDAPVERPLAVLRGDLEDLLADPRHTEAEGAWCQVTLTDPVRPLGAMERVRRRFPHTLELRFDPQGAAVALRSYAPVTERADVDVCCDFLGHVRGGRAASEQERALLQEAVEAARVGRAVAEDEGVARAASRSSGAA